MVEEAGHPAAAAKKVAEAGVEVEGDTKHAVGLKVVVEDVVEAEVVEVVAEEAADLVKWRFSGNTKYSLSTPSLH